MTFTPKLLEQYRECEKALIEAERLVGVLEEEEKPKYVSEVLDNNLLFQYSGEEEDRPDLSKPTLISEKLAKDFSCLEKMLSAESDALTMIRKHKEYGTRVSDVLAKMQERLKPFRKDERRIGFHPEPEDEPKIITYEDVKLITGNWAQCVSGCRILGLDILDIATARQIAELRMSSGKNSVYCTKGGWVAENFNYLPNGDILVASRDYNPHFKYAEEATKAHIVGKEFYLDDRIVAEILAAEKTGSVLLLKRKDVLDKISTDSFGKEPLTAFLGWDKNYGEFLNNCGIKKVKLYVANKQKQAFSRALWAGDLGDDSALGGDGDLYYGDGRVSGVRRRGEQSGTGSTGPK